MGWVNALLILVAFELPRRDEAYFQQGIFLDMVASRGEWLGFRLQKEALQAVNKRKSIE